MRRHSHKNRQAPSSALLTQPHRLIAPTLATVAILSSTTPLRAADNWLDASDNWSNPANWSTGLPTTADTVNITNTDGLPRTITYDYTGPAVSLSQLNISLSNGTGTATNTLSIPANNLTSDVELIGSNGTGTIAQSAGTNTVNLHMQLGVNAGSTGIYNLSGAGALSGNANLSIGQNGGAGVFNQSGGIVNFTTPTGVPTIMVGAALGEPNSTSTGIYYLNGGSLTATSEEIGFYGNGTFIQTAGINTLTDPKSVSLSVGNDADFVGSYTLSGTGSVTSLSESINATGTFTQNGGTNTVQTGHSGLAISLFGPPTGTYYLNNGTLTAGSLSNDGNFIQTGGDASIGEIFQNTQATLDITHGTFSFKLIGSQFAGGGINGTFTIGHDATLSLQIAGPRNAIDYAWLLIGGTASLGGTLDLDFANGFLPTVGEQFTLMNVGIASNDAIGSITGSFDTLTSDTPGLTYTIDYGPSHNEVIATITAVPEPAALSTLLAGSILLLTRRKTPKRIPLS